MAYSAGVSGQMLVDSDPTNTVFLEANDTIFFQGSGDLLGVARTSNSMVFMQGTDQTVCVSEGGTGVSVYDFGHAETFEFYGATLPTIHVMSDAAYKVQMLSAADTAVQTPDGHGGTFLTISGGFDGGKVDFAHIAPGHVNVVPA